MPELERDLRALGGTIAYPPVPNLAAVARPRLVERGPRRYRPLAVALAVLVLALAVAFAVPSARSALLRFFHIGSATVERVQALPAAEPLTARDLGLPLGRAEAEKRLGFRLALPPHARPQRVYVRQSTVATIPLRWRGKPLLLFQFLGHDVTLLKKVVPFATGVEQVRVGHEDGLWVQGGYHVLIWLDRIGRFRQNPVRVEGNALVWFHGGLMLRLQGHLAKDDALAIGRSIR